MDSVVLLVMAFARYIAEIIALLAEWYENTRNSLIFNLTTATGINVWISVAAVGISCTIYTTIGGMRAVMWTDVFQVCSYFKFFN